MQYNRELKKHLCENICINCDSTIKTANEYNIPLKTLEKWITAYNKNHKVFDDDFLSKSKLIDQLKKENATLRKENDILKKTITLLAKKE